MDGIWTVSFGDDWEVRKFLAILREITAGWQGVDDFLQPEHGHDGILIETDGYEKGLCNLH